MKSILLVTMHDPFTKDGGGLASKGFIEIFNRISDGNLDVCLADNCQVYITPHFCRKVIMVPPRTRMSRALVLVTGEMHRFTPFVKRYLEMHSNEYEYCIFDHNAIGGTLVDYARSKRLKTITIHHNYEPDYFKDNHPQRIYRNLLLPYVVRNERKAYQHSDLNLFLTQDDALTFRKVYGENHKINEVIGCFDLQECIDDSRGGSTSFPFTCVISGSLESMQTIDGIKYFFSELYQHIPCNFKIIITGRNPSVEIRQLCNDKTNVILIPNPEDISSIIRQADIYICPVKTGSGLKLRLMDGLRLGLPVLTHAIAARGYDAFQDMDGFRLFNDGGSFLQGLEGLSKSLLTGKINRVEIQRKYQENFSLFAGIQKVKKALSRL